MSASLVSVDVVRLDKWLWAARFYKTRALASQAVEGGKVHVNGQRAKPSRHVVLGDTLAIYYGHERKDVIVQALSNQRGPASVAVRLYCETEASILAREQQKELRRLNALSTPVKGYQPTRKDKRVIASLKRLCE